MDEVVEGTLVNPSGLDSVVQGSPQLIAGVRGQALLLNGRDQWVRVTGGAHRRECMGDLARCDKGERTRLLCLCVDMVVVMVNIDTYI